MDELICKHQIGDTTHINLKSKIFVIVTAKSKIDAMMMIHH